MNKSSLLLTFILLYFSFHGVSQIRSGEITYKIKSVSKNVTNENTKTDKYFNDANKKIGDLNYLLKFNYNSSYYGLVEDLVYDDNRELQMAEIIAGKGNFYITPNKKTIHEREFTSDLFLITLENDLNWKITKESKKIGKYHCYKATTTYIFNNGKITNEKIVEAWFTPEIPFPYGPKKFHGLPGMILELTDNHLQFYATEINLSQKDLIIPIPIKGIEITEKKYKEYVLQKGKERFGRRN